MSDVGDVDSQLEISVGQFQDAEGVIYVFATNGIDREDEVRLPTVLLDRLLFVRT